jgi:hypothetical protein
MTITNVRARAEGTEMMILLAPALYKVMKTPGDSMTYSELVFPHLMLTRFHSWRMEMTFPLLTSFPLSVFTVPLNLLWAESF